MSSWRLEKAKQRKLSLSSNGTVPPPPLTLQPPYKLKTSHIEEEEEELLDSRRETLQKLESNSPPKIPLPALPSPSKQLTPRTPIEELVKTVLYQSPEDKLKSIQNDFENLKKVRRSHNKIDSPVKDDDNEKLKALKRHSAAISVLSNSSSKRSSVGSANNRASFVSLT